MKKNILISICLISIFSACQKRNETGNNIKSNLAKEISFITSDSIKIFGDLYEVDKTSPVILLFHQSGSNAKAEYGSIIPKLVDKGFNILAIDQRMGGQIYGNCNRTLTNISDHSFGNPYTYCDAYNNLESALSFIINSKFTGNKIVWGSSYSASLAIQLANQNQDKINGVLAFSPASGGSMKDCLPDPYFETLKVPLLLLRPPNEMENENVKAQFELAKANGHQTYAAKHVVHGSSMLVRERVESDVSETWRVVTTFLEQIR
jgi:pimeloyl-ACP methyl ester carboxylesterase